MTQETKAGEPVAKWDSDGWADLIGVDKLPDGTLLYLAPPDTEALLQRVMELEAEKAKWMRAFKIGGTETMEKQLATHTEQIKVFNEILDTWKDAYCAFKGAFDTPQQRRRSADDYSKDARTRMREMNDKITALAKIGEQ